VPSESSATQGGAPRGTFVRREALGRLAGEHFDLLVVGGGITGVGVALDAASRGLKTALVERRDFANGTSSKSSKMVHGGIRYLAQREIGLVYESLHERQRLLDNAPHLVTPLPFLIPLFGHDGVVQKNVARAYSIALTLYDLTGGWRIGKRHKRVSRDDALAHLPTLRTDRLVAGFYYYDAWADDARLTLEIARTAALEHGAAIANYVQVENFLRDSSGKVAGARVKASEDPADTTGVGSGGGAGASDMTFEIRADAVVNATGVWADEVRSLDESSHPHSLRPAKGVHVTLPRSKLPADIAAVIPVPKDRRSIFVVPWIDGQDVYVGTTDTAWDGSLDDPVCLPEDVEYLLGALNKCIGSPVSPDDVTGVWAGLRPLLAPTATRRLSERTADLSRRHRVRTSAANLVTVTGGKLTTYRRMAEDTVDEVLKALGGEAASRAKRCRTARLPIRGSVGFRELLSPGAAREHGLDPEVMKALVGRHGAEATAVLELASGRPELLEPLVDGLPQLRVEALWAVREEMAMTVQDILSRRTRAGLRRASATADAAAGVASEVARDQQRDGSALLDDARRFSQELLSDLTRAGVDPRATRVAPAHKESGS
jgi:glycerol-3-phosphate dehydrogenase